MRNKTKVSSGRIPELTDWTAEPEGLFGRLGARLFRDKVAEKRSENHKLQQALLRREADRQPEPTVVEKSGNIIGRLLPGTCSVCHRSNALLEIDIYDILLDGYETRRCRYCLAWDQKRDYDPMAGAGP